MLEHNYSLYLIMLKKIGSIDLKVKDFLEEYAAIINEGTVKTAHNQPEESQKAKKRINIPQPSISNHFIKSGGNV